MSTTRATLIRLAGGRVPVLAVALMATAQASATQFELTEGSEVFGEDLHIKTHYSDTLSEIARRYSLGWEELIRANPKVDPWLPGEGTDLVIPGRRILPPGPHEGIVVNLPEHRLYYFPKPAKGQKPVVVTYPVSIGKMDWTTPLGQTYITEKIKNPQWNPPASVRAEHLANGDPLPPGPVKSGPDNPLGLFAMRLAVKPGDYLIHGTNNPLAVGMPITHGCIRMYPEDVEAIFPTVPRRTPVYLINAPLKVAFEDGHLLLEAHPPVDAEGQSVEPVLSQFETKLNEVLGDTTTAINWDIAEEALSKANGIPVLVGLQADLDPPPAQPATDGPTKDQAPTVSAPAPGPVPATPAAAGASGVTMATAKTVLESKS